MRILFKIKKFLLILIFLNEFMLLIKGIEDKEIIRQAIELRTEDIKDVNDFWNCISTQVIRDKFSWNRIHRIGRYESMPITIPSIVKNQLSTIDVKDPRKFYLGCVGVLKVLESKRLIISGFEDNMEKNFSRKTFCISAAEYCFPIKKQLKVVHDYFKAITEKAREALIESKEKKDYELNKKEDNQEDLKLLSKNEFEKPQHHPLLEEKIRMKKIIKNKIEFPGIGKDIEIEFIDTTMENVPILSHKIMGGDDVVQTEIDYEKLSQVSLYNIPTDPKMINKSSWNFWKSILEQEKRDNIEDNLRISILTQNYPHELRSFSMNPNKMIDLCNKVLITKLKQGLVEVSNSALKKAQKSSLVNEAISENRKLMSEYLKWKNFEKEFDINEEINEDYIAYQLVIFEFCNDSVDLFLGNRQWSKIIDRQNHKLYGLPSGRPYKPFKFTYGRDLFEMRNNCASCIWDLYSNKVVVDLFIDGYTKSGKYETSLIKETIESFCHFASIAFFQGEISLENQDENYNDESPLNSDDKKMNFEDVYKPNEYDYDKFDEKEEIRPTTYQFLSKPIDENIYQISTKSTPTGYHEFKENESANMVYLNRSKNTKALYGTKRNIDQILEEGVSVGLTVGETNYKTMEYNSIYKTNINSIVAFQQWNSIIFQMNFDQKKKKIPTLNEIPLEQPPEWNTPQYSSEKFFFVCVELISSLLSQTKIKILLPHGGELDNYERKAAETIKFFCKEATNRYFNEYDRLFDVGSATFKNEPIVNDKNINSKWSIIQEQVIVDFISDETDTVAEISPLIPNEFNPQINRIDFEDQCISAIYSGVKSSPATVILRIKEKKENETISDEKIQELILNFCKKASHRYYTVMEYTFLYQESKNWLDPKYKKPESISSQLSMNRNKSGSIQGIPWPPIKNLPEFSYKGRGRPDLYRNTCFSYIWKLWSSGNVESLYIEGTNYDKCVNLDMAKFVLEDFCTTSSIKLYQVNSKMLPQRDVNNMEISKLVNIGIQNKKRNIEVENIDDESKITESKEESSRDSETRDAEKQWEQLKQQLKRDINMNYIRFVKLPAYDQTLYTLWPKPVSENMYNQHCIKVLNELLDLRLAVITSQLLDDRQYIIEKFCEESKFYVYSDIKEENKYQDFNKFSLNTDNMNERMHNYLMDILRELSNEGYPLYRWLETIIDLRSEHDRSTLLKAIKWGQKKDDWHFLDIIIRNLDKEVFLKIQRHLRGISPQGFVMSAGLFDKENTMSTEATWGAIYLQSIKDARSNNKRIIGLIGSTPPSEIWPGANNEQEFVLSCIEALKKLKVNPPFITFNTNGQSERGYIQLFCEDALDTLLDIQREPEKVLSLDFAYPGCINEAMRKWQWHQIYSQMELDYKNSEEYRITGIPPVMSYKIFKGGKTPDEIEDQCGNALEELDKSNQIKILNKQASLFCHDAVENICKIDSEGKTNCNIERIKFEEIISEYHMDTPIGNPLKLDSRTRCMRIWTLLKSSLSKVVKDRIISVNGDFGMDKLLENDILSTSYTGNIRFIALKEMMDVCSPIDTPNNIISVFMIALKKIQQINSLVYSEEAVLDWVKEMVVRYLADERTENEYIELTGVNVFGDPYSKEDNTIDFLNKGLHSRGIPKKVRQLTDNEKAVLKEKENQKINSLVEGIVQQVLPSLLPLTTKEKKKEITNRALMNLQKDSEERDVLVNNININRYGLRPHLSEEEKQRLSLGKISIPILNSKKELNSAKPVKIFTKIDTRWNKMNPDTNFGYPDIEMSHNKYKKRKLSEEYAKSIERNIGKLQEEWNAIKNFKSYVISKIPENRPDEYGEQGHRDLFNRDSMIRRCINFFTNENLVQGYKIHIKGNYVERIAHIKTHCTRSANRAYSLKNSSSRSLKHAEVTSKAKSKATHRAGRLIHVKGKYEPLQQVLTKQRIVSGDVLIESEISPEELENQSDYINPVKPDVIEHVGSNDGYKAISSEFKSKRKSRK